MGIWNFKIKSFETWKLFQIFVKFCFWQCGTSQNFRKALSSHDWCNTCTMQLDKNCISLLTAWCVQVDMAVLAFWCQWSRHGIGTSIAIGICTGTALAPALEKKSLSCSCNPAMTVCHTIVIWKMQGRIHLKFHTTLWHAIAWNLVTFVQCQTSAIAMQQRLSIVHFSCSLLKFQSWKMTCHQKPLKMKHFNQNFHNNHQNAYQLTTPGMSQFCWKTFKFDTLKIQINAHCKCTLHCAKNVKSWNWHAWQTKTTNAGIQNIWITLNKIAKNWKIENCCCIELFVKFLPFFSLQHWCEWELCKNANCHAVHFQSFDQNFFPELHMPELFFHSPSVVIFGKKLLSKRSSMWHWPIRIN